MFIIIIDDIYNRCQTRQRSNVCWKIWKRGHGRRGFSITSVAVGVGWVVRGQGGERVVGASVG